MKKLRYLLLLLPFLFINNVNADTITNYSTNYFYYQENVGANSTGYRSGSNNKVILGGTENQGNNFDYLYGVINDIQYPISKGTRYSVKICLRYSSLGDNEFNENNFHRFNDINLTYGSPQIQVEAVSSVYDITQPLLLQVDVCSSYNFIAKQSNDSFAIGFRSNSYNSFGVYRHQYNITASVYSVDVLEGATSIQPIVDQNNIIINQNQSIINNQNDINNSINNVDDTLKDDNTQQAQDSAGGFFNDFTTDTHGLTAIITAPLSLITNITSASCSPLVIPLPYVDKDLTLPCMGEIYSNYFGPFLSIYQMISFGILAYWVLVRIFNLVKDFKNPDHDEIEVLDL